MLGAVGLLLGNRADSKALFTENEKCIVEGTFEIGEYKLQPLFEETDLDYENETIIRREISPSGKSRAFINDSPVTLDILKVIGRQLMDIHSQHENLELSNNHYQLEILDLYAGNTELLEKYAEKYNSYSNAKKHYDELIYFSQSNEKPFPFAPTF